MNILRTFGWVIGIIYATIPPYWLLIHPRIQFWRSRRARLVTVGPLWMLLWVVAGAVTWPWRHVLLYNTPWTWFPAALLIVFAEWVYLRARKDFSNDQVFGRSELEPARHEQRLNTAGIRARIRHPFYLGHLCHLIGWTIGTGLAVLYVLTVVAVLLGIIMVRAEEEELVARFGEEYRRYQQRVPAILPRLSPRNAGGDHVP